MRQLLSLWHSLDPRRRIIVVFSTLAMFGAVLAMSKIAATPSMSLLYGRMEATSAGEVVAALEQRKVMFEVRGDAIYVETAQRDALRMNLAADGLPATDSQGYEILDALSGFGTTSQMFDAAYWRAKEGELARTILASPNVKAVRVHLSNTASGPFRKNTPMSASVTVSGTGIPVSAANARALKFLVASAVAGLSPDNVSIIDGLAGMVIGSDDEASSNGNARDRGTEMRQRVERILEARVGVGKAIVEINVETVTERESISERTFDPNTRVAISTDTEERSTNSNENGTNGVTVASNLPEGDANSQNDSSSTQNSEIRERTNYEVSEVKREILRIPGSIKRVSVAVLVDGQRSVGENGAEEFSLRSEEEIQALTELVASSVGFNEARGDIITIKSMAFEPLLEQGTQATPKTLSDLGLDMMALIQIGVLALVSLILGLFVLRPILSSPKSTAIEAPPQVAIAPPVPPMPEFDLPATVALNGEIESNDVSAPNIAATADFDISELDTLPALAINQGFSGETLPSENDPVARLREMIKERQEETVATLKNWMEDEETA